MAKGGQPSTGKGVFSRIGVDRSTLLQDLADKPLAQFVVFGLFVLAIVGVMTLGFQTENRIRDYEVGEVAPHDVKATRDFVFVEKDMEASEKERARAARDVPHVYDWQEGLGESIRDRTSNAFGGMRQAMANTILERMREERPRELERLEEETPPMGLSTALLERVPPRERVEIANLLRSQHFDQVLGVSLRDSDFETFARAGFPERAENALASVVGEVMTHIIVPSKRIIESEDEAGVFLRRLRDDKVLIEYHVANVDARVIPLESVPSLVDEVSAQRLASMGDRALRSAITSAATALVRPNTTFNAAETAKRREAAREAVDDRVLREEFRQGQVIVDKGHLITERHLRILQQMETERELLNRSQVVAGIVVFCLLLLATLFLFGRRNIRKFRPAGKDIVFMALTMLILIALTRAGLLLSQAIVELLPIVPVEAWYFAIPVAASGMLIRLVLNSESAIVFTVLFAVLAGVMADNSLFFMSFTAIGGLVGAGAVKTVKNRMGLIWSGLTVAGVNVIAVLSFLLIDGQLLQAGAWDSLVQASGYVGLAVIGGIFSGFVASGLLPLFETLFGYTTDIKLLELSNLNHPALRELIMRAPGSYHHSMMVGSLCEAAAEAIGCNPLLSRVGAYYHDIGKAKNPQYFAENQKLGENPHDKLKPNISALVIKAHVKDGLEMAKQYRLPKAIQDFIAQHHGTSLIRYFYHKAKQLEDPDIPEVVESDYRYPGPKPQTRETAICLLADGTEAASRAMPNPTPARLRGLVQKMINLAFTDGQLDDCDLTLKDLNEIADAFHRILTGIYHHRPEYPGKKKSEGKPETEKSGEVKRRQRKTDRIRRVTPATAAQQPEDAEERERELALSMESDASGDFEITQQQIDDLEEDLNGGRNLREADGEDASEDSEAEGDDSDEGRQSLPRLGSH